MNKRQLHIILTLFPILFSIGCTNYNLLQNTNIKAVKTLEEIPSSKNYADINKFKNQYSTNTTNLSSDAYIYKIQTKDKLSLSIWDHPNLSVGTVFDKSASANFADRFIVVEENGYAMFPKIGMIKVVNKTIAEARTELLNEYSNWIKNPEIVLRVENKQITFLGAIKSPGNYTLDENTYTFGEVLGKVGGVDQFANTKQCQLLRDGISYKFDMTKIAEINYHQFKIYAGDILFIPFNSNKSMSERSTSILSITSILSTIAIFLSITK